MILGFIIGEAGDEITVSVVVGDKLGRFTHEPCRSNFNELFRHFTDALFELRFARLPTAATQSIKLNLRVFTTIARQQLDILNRKKQLVSVVIMQLQTVMRMIKSRNRAQPDKATDAMVNVNNHVIDRQAGDLRDKVLGPFGGCAATHQTLTENILLANDSQIRQLEPGLQRKDSQADLCACQTPRKCQRSDRLEAFQTMVSHHPAKTFTRALSPCGKDDTFAGGLKLTHMGHGCIENVDVFIGPLNGKNTTFTRVQLHHFCGTLLRHSEGGQPYSRFARNHNVQLVICPVQRRGCKRLVRRRSRRYGLKTTFAVCIVVRHLCQPFFGCIQREIIQNQDSAGKIIGELAQLLVEQRNPVFHAGVTPPLTDGLVEKIAFGCRSESGKIPLPKATNSIRCHLKFAGRNKLK